MSRLRVIVVGCALILAGRSAHADVRLPGVFSDHMVVQQGQAATVWGWASANEKLAVHFGDNSAETTAGADGRWSVRIAPPPSGGPYELRISGANTITLTDVLVGEVWLCSGQSNMQWTVAQAMNPAEEAAAANFPAIRHLEVARNPAQSPQDDLQEGSKEKWQVCRPETVAKFTAVGYFFGRKLHQDLKVPVGLVNSSWGGTICEAWTSHPSLEARADFQPILERDAEFRPGNPNQAAALFNGMIHPLRQMTIRGVIWYQGESNLRRAEQYGQLFPNLIQDWRKNFDQGDLPFLFVQLAPYRYNGQDPRHCAELWEAQLQTLTVPNVGMAVTTDIGDVRDIHPKNKQEVGRRLALWALAKTYGKELVYSGPLYESAAIEGKSMRIRFQHVAGGLASRDGKPLTHFEIAADDERFVPATATVDGETLLITSDQVEKPVAVRFAWTDTSEPNFMNQEGLPASPFRTDKFPRVTAGNVK